jgi:hypothetical protein
MFLIVIDKSKMSIFHIKDILGIIVQKIGNEWKQFALINTTCYSIFTLQRQKIIDNTNIQFFNNLLDGYQMFVFKCSKCNKIEFGIEDSLFVFPYCNPCHKIEN